MKFRVYFDIEADTQDDANAVRSEAMEGLQDADDSGELPNGVTFDMGVPAPIETERHAALISLARERYGSDSIEVDDSADTSEGEHGAWVGSWLFLPNDVLHDAGLLVDEEPELADISEGGDCD